MRRDRGQATVETVLLLPLVLAVALAVHVVLAAGRAREEADAAAHGAAVALLQDGDPRAAARAAVPAATRGRMSVGLSGRRVTVRVVPAVPLFARSLAATARASAGAAR